MAGNGIQLRLQKELFTPSNEQLLSMVHCNKSAGDKDRTKTKDIYLCVVNETGRFSRHNQLDISIVEVKGSEKRGDLPKRKRNWTLHELRHIDGKHREGGSTNSKDDYLFPGEFDLGFGDKVFSYKAFNYEEKKRFLTTLVSLSDRVHVGGTAASQKLRKISLKNLPPDMVLEETLKSKGRSASGDDNGAAAAEENKDSWPMMGKDETDDSYQAISDRDLPRIVLALGCLEPAVESGETLEVDAGPSKLENGRSAETIPHGHGVTGIGPFGGSRFQAAEHERAQLLAVLVQFAGVLAFVCDLCRSHTDSEQIGREHRVAH